MYSCNMPNPATDLQYQSLNGYKLGTSFFDFTVPYYKNYDGSVDVQL